jgi:hypothetical protein
MSTGLAWSIRAGRRDSCWKRARRASVDCHPARAASAPHGGPARGGWRSRRRQSRPGAPLPRCSTPQNIVPGSRSSLSRLMTRHQPFPQTFGKGVFDDPVAPPKWVVVCVRQRVLLIGCRAWPTWLKTRLTTANRTLARASNRPPTRVALALGWIVAHPGGRDRCSHPARAGRARS